MVIHVQLQGNRRGPSWLLFVPGAILILLGILILVLPNLLEVLVASACIFIGIALLAVPMRMRGMMR